MNSQILQGTPQHQFQILQVKILYNLPACKYSRAVFLQRASATKVGNKGNLESDRDFSVVLVCNMAMEMNVMNPLIYMQVL